MIYSSKKDTAYFWTPPLSKTDFLQMTLTCSTQSLLSPREWAKTTSGMWSVCLERCVLAHPTMPYTHHANLKPSWLDFRWRPLKTELLERWNILLETFPLKVWMWHTVGTVSNKTQSGNDTTHKMWKNFLWAFIQHQAHWKYTNDQIKLQRLQLFLRFFSIIQQ